MAVAAVVVGVLQVVPAAGADSAAVVAVVVAVVADIFAAVDANFPHIPQFAAVGVEFV